MPDNPIWFVTNLCFGKDWKESLLGMLVNVKLIFISPFKRVEGGVYGESLYTWTVYTKNRAEILLNPIQIIIMLNVPNKRNLYEIKCGALGSPLEHYKHTEFLDNYKV